MENLNIKSFIHNQILNNLQANERRSYFLYSQNELDYTKNKYTKKVILFNRNTKEKKIIETPFEVNGYIINQNRIIFTEIENNVTSLYRYNIESQSITKLSTIQFEIDQFSIMNNTIFFTADIQKFNLDDPYKCSTNSPFLLEGKGVKGDRLKSLFKASLDGKNISLLSTLDLDIENIDFDRENSRILMTVRKKAVVYASKLEVYLYDVEKDELKLLLNKNIRISGILSFDRERILLWGIDLSAKSRNQNQELMVINCETKKVRNYGFGTQYSNEHPSIITDAFFYNGQMLQKYKNKIYIKLVKRNKETIYEIDLNGTVREKALNTTMINEYIVSDDGIYYIGLKKQALQELYLNDQKLTSHNNWLTNFKVSKPEKIEFKINDLDYDGWVIPPSQLKEEKIYPAILFIHGGPKMMYSSVFSFDMYLLSAAGYYVFYMNPRGSDGRGDAYSDIRGNFASIPYEELLIFTDCILELYPSIDPNKLGVTGGSYGGYMTNYIITHTDKFKAAVSERGISNLMTAFTSSDIGNEFIFEYMGNHDTPWYNTEAYIKNSPIYQVDQVRTPTLFIHGEKDYRCHYTESLNMFNALNYHGVSTKLCLFTNESHSLTVKGKPVNKYKRYQELLDWFNRYLRGGNQ